MKRRAPDLEFYALVTTSDAPASFEACFPPWD